MHLYKAMWNLSGGAPVVCQSTETQDFSVYLHLVKRFPSNLLGGTSECPISSWALVKHGLKDHGQSNHERGIHMWRHSQRVVVAA